MKTSFFIFLFMISSIGFAQNNYIVKTEDGRRVLLKADFTWEYIDMEAPANVKAASVEPKPTKDKVCNLGEDFKEPALNKKIQAQLKRGRATIEHVKEKVAKDNNCTVEEVVLLSVSEKKSSGFYDFCANGKKVSYKRVGNTIIEKGKLF